ncbi:MAG: hypothetical protein U0350_32980 [Caldilineaceae bacterium]
MRRWQWQPMPAAGRLACCTSATTLERVQRKLEADVVILATGWQQRLPFLSEELQTRWRCNRRVACGCIVTSYANRIGLYRLRLFHGLPVDGEIGTWLAQCFKELTLGPVDEMEREIDLVLQWAAEVFPGRSQGYFIGPYVTHYVDDLCATWDCPAAEPVIFSPNISHPTGRSATDVWVKSVARLG